MSRRKGLEGKSFFYFFIPNACSLTKPHKTLLKIYIKDRTLQTNEGGPFLHTCFSRYT